MSIRYFLLAIFPYLALADEVDPDIATIPPDLTIPAVEHADPAPGHRVFYRLPGDPDTAPAMVLYLPAEWSPEKRFPVLCEYAGNGNFKNAFGDVSTGRPEGSQIGYGLSGGTGCIWVCLPFLNEAGDKPVSYTHLTLPPSALV